MRLSVPRPRDWLLLAAAVVVAAAGALAVTAEVAPPRAERNGPAAAAQPAATATPEPAVPRIGVVTTVRLTVVRVVASPTGEATSFLRAGVLLPIRAETKRFVRVETPCELDGWVARRDVSFVGPAAKSATALRDATIVIDPGHGGIDSGAIGPAGLQEKAVNLDISRRVQ